MVPLISVLYLSLISEEGGGEGGVNIEYWQNTYIKEAHIDCDILEKVLFSPKFAITATKEEENSISCSHFVTKILFCMNLHICNGNTVRWNYTYEFGIQWTVI